MKRVCLPLVQTIVLCPFATFSTSAQSPNPGQAKADFAVSQGQSNATWVAVTRLAPDTVLNISAKTGGGHCVLISVSDSSVTCRHGSAAREVRRDDIKRIRLSRRGRSALIGFAIGAGGGQAQVLGSVRLLTAPIRAAYSTYREGSPQESALRSAYSLEEPQAPSSDTQAMFSLGR